MISPARVASGSAPPARAVTTSRSETIPRGRFGVPTSTAPMECRAIVSLTARMTVCGGSITGSWLETSSIVVQTVERIGVVPSLAVRGLPRPACAAGRPPGRAESPDRRRKRGVRPGLHGRRTLAGAPAGADARAMAPLPPARRGELLLAGSLVGLVAGAVARLAGARAAADAAWATVAAAALVALAATVVTALWRRAPGVDVVAVLALAGCLAEQ